MSDSENEILTVIDLLLRKLPTGGKVRGVVCAVAVESVGSELGEIILSSGFDFYIDRINLLEGVVALLEKAIRELRDEQANPN